MNAKIKKKYVIINYQLLVLSFIVAFFLILAQGWDRPFPNWMLFSSWIIFILLGISLIIVTYKAKIKGKLKKYLLLTGYSSSTCIASIVLHNLFHAFGILTNNISILKISFEVIGTLFFLIAIIIAPLGFLLGVAVSTIILVKQKKTK